MAKDWQPQSELPDLPRAGIVALDIETHDAALAANRGSGWATRQGHVCGVSLAYRADGALHSLYIPIRHPDSENFAAEQVYAWLKDLFASGASIVTQNGLYDYGWLRTEGDVPMPPDERLEEIGALATLINENRHRYSLQALCEWRGLPGKDETLLHEGCAALGLTTNTRKKFKPQNHIWQLPARYVGPYAEADVVSTLRLFEELNPILDQENTRAAYRLECDLLPMVLEMRRRGVRIDVAAAERARDYLLGKRDAVLAELSDKLHMPVSMHELARSKWLAETFDREGIKYPRTEKGNPSFTGGQKGWMDRHEHWLPRLIWAAGKYHKAGADFVDNFILGHVVNGRVHAEIHPHRSEDHGTKSLRFSYSDPPLQQMVARDEELTPLIRGLFLPEEGELWAKADASQQEFRLAVHYAAVHKVPKADITLQRYRDDPDADFHALAGQMTGLDRQSAKAVNFAKMYGAGPKKFATMIGRPLNEASAIYEQYDHEFPFLHALSEIYQGIARRQGYVTLYDGARRHFNTWAPGGKWEKGAGPCERTEAERRLADPSHPWFRKGRLFRADTRNALNALIQGSAARHTKLWMRAVWREGIAPLLQMHDALECSVATREQAEMVAQLGVNAIRLKIAMRVDLAFGRDWGAAKHTWEELQRVAAPASAPEPVQCDESPALIELPIESEAEAELDETPVSPESVPMPEQPALHMTETKTDAPPPPPPPPSARAKQTDDGYRRGEDGGIAEDFDFSADLIWPGIGNAAGAAGASTKTDDGAKPAGAKTNGGAESSARNSTRPSYIYRTTAGTPYLKVVRTPAKTFPTYHWTGHGWAKGWPATVIPYRLPELIAAPASEPVWITEGEKDANNIAKLGLIATTNPGGAKQWQPELVQWFKGKQLAYVLEDNDDDGRKHTSKITAALRGIVPEIVTVSFPELPEKGDVSDWLDAGGNRKLLIARAEQARKRGATPPYIITNLSTVTPRATKWMWLGHLARGALELMAGTPEIGKSQIQCQYIACATTGRNWPNNAPGIEPCRVIMLTAEDTTDSTLVPRLRAAGADLRLVKKLKAIRRNDRNEAFLLGEDLDKLEQIIRDFGDVGLVTVDPITAYMGHSKHFDSHRTTDVRSQLMPLKELAERTNIAFSAVTHPPKNAGPRALDHFIGSQAFIAAARIGHLCVPEMEEGPNGGKRETGRRFYTNPKINIAARQTTLIYQVAVIPTGDRDEETGEAINAPVIQWAGQADITADEALAATKTTKGKGGLTAQDFLADYLAGGPQLQTAVIERGAERGFTERQLRHAKAKLSVVSFKKGFDNGAWFWALPEHVPQGADVMDNVIQFPKPEPRE